MAKAFQCDDCGEMFEGGPFKGNPIAREHDDILTVEIFTIRCQKDLCQECTAKRLRAILKKTVMKEDMELNDSHKAKGKGAREVALEVQVK